MELKIDNQAVIELAAQKVADAVMYQEDDLSIIANREIERRIDKIFKDRAETQIEATIDAAISGSLDREYHRINSFGEKDGGATTIRKELEKLANNYWAAQVDAKTGKPSSSSYNSVSRAQFVMAQICAEDFTEQMKKAAISVTAAMKDGFRAELARHVDKTLDELFRVRSVQDQGKAVKPW